MFSNVAKVILYGSRAKGTYSNGSDIDLTLVGENLSLSALNEISIALDDLNLPYTIDLSILSQIENPELVDHIHRVGKVFYTRDNQDSHNAPLSS